MKISSASALAIAPLVIFQSSQVLSGSLSLQRRTPKSPQALDVGSDQAMAEQAAALARSQAMLARTKYGDLASGHLPASPDTAKPAGQDPEAKRARRDLALIPSSRDALASGIALGNYETGTSFFTNISIGTPGQDVQVVLDTGSSDTWVSASFFYPGRSTSFQPLSAAPPFKIQYGGGTVAGALGTDDMLLARHLVTNQTFALADTLSDGLVNTAVHGIMGMAFQGLSASGQNPLWYGAAMTDRTFACERPAQTDQVIDKCAALVCSHISFYKRRYRSDRSLL